jgi:hypothetical protein
MPLCNKKNLQNRITRIITSKENVIMIYIMRENDRGGREDKRVKDERKILHPSLFIHNFLKTVTAYHRICR